MKPFEDSLTDFSDKNLGKSPIPHLLQRTDWDCGLTCVAMVLRGLGVHHITLDQLHSDCPTKEVWTIYLAYLVAKYSKVDFTFYTSYLGANPNHLTEDFYSGLEGSELQRVDELFITARRYEINIIRLQLPIRDFQRFLYTRKFSIICLVDSNKLNCLKCSEKYSQVNNAVSGGVLGCKPSVGCLNLLPNFNCFPKLFSSKSAVNNGNKGDGYYGHYIVLIGYEPETDTFIYRDPSCTDYYCVIHTSQLDLARRAQGTDDDCIVVKMD